MRYMLPGKVLREVRARGQWLLILMMFQSGSSFVLNHYETLVREHLVLTLFLTMLVGAGKIRLIPNVRCAATSGAPRLPCQH